MTNASVSARDINKSIVVTGDGNAVRLTFGDSGIILPMRRLQFSPIDRRRPPTAGEPTRELGLLVPAAGKLPFIGRRDILAELQTWLDDKTVDLSVHALTGQAGTGKTRVAMEFCRIIDNDPNGKGAWLAGFIAAADLREVVRALATRDFAWKSPTLLVIDHAAQCQELLAHWLDRLAEQKLSTRLRILLLDREAPEEFGWWHELAATAPPGRRDLFHTPRPRRLPDLTELEERRALLTAAVEAARRLRPTAPLQPGVPAKDQDTAFDRRLAEPQFGNPLNLVMAGLITIDRDPRQALALRRLDAARALGRAELARLSALARSQQVSPSAMTHIIGFNGLVGGLFIANLREAVANELEASQRRTNLDPLLTLLQQELPPHKDATAEPRLATTQPDLIGEAIVIEAFTGDPAREAEATSTTRRAFRLRPHTSRALVGLVQDFAYALEDATATDQEKATGRRTMEWLLTLMRDAEAPEHMLPLAEALPLQTTILREPAAELTDRLVALLRDEAQRTNDLHAWGRAAAQLNNLSNRFSDLGQREAALAAIEEAVAIYRNLTAARPGAFRPVLALSLNTLSNQLSALGQREATLAAIEEAVAIYRDLTAVRPDAFRPDLAGLLNNISVQLSALGQREAALAAIEEAVTIFRELTAARPDAFRPDLALSLNTLSTQLSDLGRWEAALAAIEEAVAIYRDLTAARPEAFRPDLAGSLNTLSVQLSGVGQREAALAAIDEAVAIYRDLAAARPDAFRPDLALALNTLSNRSSALGRREAALSAIQEAVAMYRDLAAARPDAFRPDLAGSLNTLSNQLSALGRREAALAAIEKAVAICRELAADRSDAFRPDLARSLGMVAYLHAEAGEPESSTLASQEGIELLTPTFVAIPAAVNQLMTSLTQIYRAALGREPGEALLRPVLAAFERLNSTGNPE